MGIERQSISRVHAVGSNQLFVCFGLSRLLLVTSTVLEVNSIIMWALLDSLCRTSS